MKLLTAGSFELTDERRDFLESLGFDIIVSEREDTEFDFDPSDIEAVICNWLFVNHDIREFTALKYIQLLSAGLDRVPLDYINEKNITLHNARGVYSIPMAEFAVGGVLQLYKQSRFFFDNQKERKWEKSRKIRELNGAEVCIVGAGSVGQETAKRFGAFTDNIIGVDLFPCSSPYFREILPLDKLDDALSESDIIVLTLPLTEQTKGLFSREKIGLMKRDAVIVNVARGGIIDEAALRDALDNDMLYGAVLDVFEEEPLSEGNILWGAKNVIITPHNSFVSDRNSERMWNVTASNLKQFISERK